MNLQELGWSADWTAHFRPHAANGLAPGRICVEHKELYRLYTEHGERSAVISGKLRHAATARCDFPAVGDWVAVQLQGEREPAIIQAVLPRRNKFSRKVAGEKMDEQIVAANLDTVFLVTSLNREFNLRRLERYLSLTWSHGANPVILLSKLDLCDNPQLVIEQVETIAFDTPIHVVSAKTGAGLANLQRYLHVGATVALLGSSGVGKSTLVNRLLGQCLQDIQEIRADDDRGRHTTTCREMLRLPSGGLLIDTPGMRELQLWDGEAGLDETFTDIVTLAAQCFYRDCQHEVEPRCAVQQALAEGDLDAGRFANYAKMQKELAYQTTREDPQAMREKQSKLKKLMARHNKEYRRRR